MNDGNTLAVKSDHDAFILVDTAMHAYLDDHFGLAERFLKLAAPWFRTYHTGHDETGQLLMYLAECLFFQNKQEAISIYLEALTILEHSEDETLRVSGAQTAKERLARILEVQTRGQSPN